jgi:hypothetical protein
MSIKEEIKEIKSILTWGDVIPGSPALSSGKTYTLIRCPWHADRSASLSIRLDGKWTCHGCDKRGDILDWVGYTLFGEGYSQNGDQLRHVIDTLAAQQIIPMTDRERGQWSQQYRDEPEQKAEGDETAFDIRMRLHSESQDWHRALLPSHRRTLHGWGIEDAVIDQFLVGWNGRRFSFPARYRGVTFAIKLRAPDGSGVRHKWTSSTGSRGGIYGADLLTDSPKGVVVTEDEKSTLSLRSHGLPSIGTSGGAGFWRSRTANWWVRLLLGVPRMVFWRDADEVKVPVWQPEKQYWTADSVQLPGRLGRFFLRCQEDGISGILPPEVHETTSGPAIVDGTTSWKVVPNPGLQCATDFRIRFPRAIIVDSSPWKDAGDAVRAGIDPRDVIFQKGGIAGF